MRDSDMPVPQLQSKHFKLEPVWFVHVELASRDDSRVREAVTKAVGLFYGRYDRVALETSDGIQFFHPIAGSHLGEGAKTITLPVRVLSFSIVRDEALLQSALEAIHHAHSYEEPVVYITESFASRAIYAESRDNPNRWWNRGFAE
jgi:hypothetical protein